MELNLKFFATNATHLDFKGFAQHNFFFTLAFRYDSDYFSGFSD